GRVPAVLIGSFFSSRAPDKYIRPIITFVIFASGLKYAGVGTSVLGWVLCAVALTGGTYWLFRTQPWRNGKLAVAPADQAGSAHGAAAARAGGATRATRPGAPPAGRQPPAPHRPAPRGRTGAPRPP